MVNFLLSTEIIPLCLRTMEMGSELSKTVATFIVQKILLDDVGLAYICATAERFFAVRSQGRRAEGGWMKPAGGSSESAQTMLWALPSSVVQILQGGGGGRIHHCALCDLVL